MKRSHARSKESVEFARSQRRDANEFADTVWQWLRNRQIENRKFRREVPIPPYTVDFCCIELKLVIEIDGQGHFTEEGIAYDQRRDAFLAHQGYQVLRIAGYEVIREDSPIIDTIRTAVKSRALSLNLPSPRFGERGRG